MPLLLLLLVMMPYFKFRYFFWAEIKISWSYPFFNMTDRPLLAYPFFKMNLDPKKDAD